jgi:hypothetical protein
MPHYRVVTRERCLVEAEYMIEAGTAQEAWTAVRSGLELWHKHEVTQTAGKPLLLSLQRLNEAAGERPLCDHLGAQCKGDWTTCNDCGETWMNDEEDCP